MQLRTSLREAYRPQKGLHVRTARFYFSHMMLALLLLGTALVSTAAADSVFCFDADMLGGSSTVCANVYDNPNGGHFGRTVFAVHGFTEAAASWEPLAGAMFEDRFLKRSVKRVIAIDLPGRGNSPMPEGLPGGVYGNLYEEDYIDIVVQALEALRDAGMGPQVIIGHSMGGLAVQGVQEQLLSQGESLASLGVHQAILLGSLPADGAIWNQIPFPEFVLDLFTQGTDDGPFGRYIFFPQAAAQTGPGFTTLAGELADNTPPVSEIAVGAEAYNVTHQINATPDFPSRPFTRERAFSLGKGTLLTVVAFSQDAFVIPADQEALYEYLTGLPAGYFYRFIDTPQAVHNMYITEPDVVAKAIRLLAN